MAVATRAWWALVPNETLLLEEGPWWVLAWSLVLPRARGMVKAATWRSES